MACLRILLILFITSNCFGAQFTSFTEETSPTGTDSIYLIKSGGGSGTDRYLTFTNLVTYLDALLMSDIVDDTTPQLGGNLDIQAFNIEGVDATEFGYLDPTSSVQTQLDAKAPSASPTLTNPTLGTIASGDGSGLTNIGVSALDTDVTNMFQTIDGLAFDKPALYVEDDSGLKIDIEKLGGGDMRFLIDGVISTLNCTTSDGSDGMARASLTPGSDANTPSTNYIYVTDSDGSATLNANTTLPTGAFGWVGKIIVPDATSWATTGEFGIQRYTEAFSNSNRGTQSHSREKLRALGAVYISGVGQTTNITPNGGAADAVHVATGSGQVHQLHRQTFPAFTTGPYYYGNGQNMYEQITDLNAALAESDGTSLSGKRFNLVIWGAVNYSSGDCKLFVNLPDGSYVNSGQTRSDRDNTADYTVPDDMRSVAFMICRVALRHTTVASGTWTELGTYSLLGTPSGARSGGAGAVASNEFDDTQFRIYDDGDSTSQIAFQASAITTATTRTITMPDQDIDLTPGGTFMASGLDSVPTAAVYLGTTSLEETNSGDSGAGIVGVYNEFTNSNSTNVQDVLDDLDAAIDASNLDWNEIGDPDAASEINFGSHISELNVEDFRIGDGSDNYIKFSGSGATFVGDYTLTCSLTSTSQYGVEGGADNLSDDTYSGTAIHNRNAGESITQWDAVFFNSADSEWHQADADGSGEWPARGMAVTSASDGSALVVLTTGTVRNDGWSWSTVGGPLYVSDTAGGLTETAPSTSGDCVQLAGWVLSDDEAYINFSGHYLEVE